MTANKYGDYELLAKLIYPSIEASGNVYYGQTRKLTTDNTFGRNELNFDSHIETFSSGSSYQSYFNWRVGPLSGAVRIEPLDKDSNNNPVDFTTLNFPNSDVYEVSLDGYTEKITDQNYALHGVMFAKYKLIFSDKKIDNNLYSGNFSTYENNISCEYKNIIVRNHIYMDGYDPYTRSFYVEKEGLDWYLYIQVGFDKLYSYTNHEVSTPFTVKSINGVSSVKITNKENFLISEDGNNWSDILDELLLIDDQHTLSFKIKPDVSATATIIIDKSIGQLEAQAIVYGNINSLKFNDYDTGNKYSSSAFASLFGTTQPGGTSNITDASKLILPAITLENSCYKQMFMGQILLEYAPKLPAIQLADSCYESMFEGCTALKVAPLLQSYYLSTDSYKRMFKNCTSLNTISFRAKWNYATHTEDWLENAGVNSQKKVAWCDTSYNDYPSDDSGIPNVWERLPLNDYYIKPFIINKFNSIDNTYKGFCCNAAKSSNNQKLQFVVSSGSDSDFNGRGKLNDSTKFKMETSFDENNTHQMDTYNNDGSYNQEIWGYKSFNSPVKFRNGIYGECGSLITYEPDEYTFFINNTLGEWSDDYNCSGNILKCNYTDQSYVSYVYKSSESCLALSTQHGTYEGLPTVGADLELSASSGYSLNPHGEKFKQPSTSIEMHSYSTYDEENNSIIDHYNELNINASGTKIHLDDSRINLIVPSGDDDYEPRFSVLSEDIRTAVPIIRNDVYFNSITYCDIQPPSGVFKNNSTIAKATDDGGSVFFDRKYIEDGTNKLSISQIRQISKTGGESCVSLEYDTSSTIPKIVFSCSSNSITKSITMNSNGEVLPGESGSITLGSLSKPWHDIYTKKISINSIESIEHGGQSLHSALCNEGIKFIQPWQISISLNLPEDPQRVYYPYIFYYTDYNVVLAQMLVDTDNSIAGHTIMLKNTQNKYLYFDDGGNSTPNILEFNGDSSTRGFICSIPSPNRYSKSIFLIKSCKGNDLYNNDDSNCVKLVYTYLGQFGQTSVDLTYSQLVDSRFTVVLRSADGSIIRDNILISNIRIFDAGGKSIFMYLIDVGKIYIADKVTYESEQQFTVTSFTFTNAVEIKIPTKINTSIDRAGNVVLARRVDKTHICISVRCTFISNQTTLPCIANIIYEINSNGEVLSYQRDQVIVYFTDVTSDVEDDGLDTYNLTRYVSNATCVQSNEDDPKKAIYSIFIKNNIYYTSRQDICKINNKFVYLVDFIRSINDGCGIYSGQVYPNKVNSISFT